jgi:hypothetical protein
MIALEIGGRIQLERQSVAATSRRDLGIEFRRFCKAERLCWYPIRLLLLVLDIRSKLCEEGGLIHPYLELSPCLAGCRGPILHFLLIERCI